MRRRSAAFGSQARRTLVFCLVVALAGCSSEPARQETPPPAKEPRAWPPAAADTDLAVVATEMPLGPSGAGLRLVAERAADDLRASGLFGADVLDVRAVMDRSGQQVATGDLEEALRRRIAAQGLHVLARNDPRTPERAVVAVPVFGFVDALPHEKRVVLRFQFAVASEARGAALPRLVWAFEARLIATPVQPVTSPLSSAALDDVARGLADEVAKKHTEALEVQPATDRTAGFPGLALDASLRARLVRRGVPVVWRRAPGVDAPPALSAGQSAVKSLDHARLAGEVTELPDGKAQLGLKLEKFNPATRRLEIHAAFDRTFAR